MTETCFLKLFVTILWVYWFCLTGIRKRLNYIKTVVKSNILYINSMYESNDDDHMTLVDQRKIAPVFGTMDDFDMLLKDTQKMASMYGNMTFLNEILKIFCRMWNLINSQLIYVVCDKIIFSPFVWIG